MRRLPVKSPANRVAAAFSERAYELTQKLIVAFDAVQSPCQVSNVEVLISSLNVGQLRVFKIVSSWKPESPRISDEQQRRMMCAMRKIGSVQVEG